MYNRPLRDNRCALPVHLDGAQERAVGDGPSIMNGGSLGRPMRSPHPAGASAGDRPLPAGRETVRLLALNVAIAGAYVVAAVVGFRFAFVAEQITTVWAPTGIALAALLAGGLRLWPAVWAGAFLANAATGAPTWTAAVIACGNTLEAVTAVWWLRRSRRVDLAFERVGDVLAFVIVAALTCTAIAATVGVATLCAAHVQPWDRFRPLWVDWWLGDAMGALVVAPALLTSFSPAWSRRPYARAAVWIAGSVLVTYLVFGQVRGASPHPLEYVVFPLVIGAAVSGGPRLTSLVVLSASAVAIWYTAHGSGPFASAGVHQSLILVQAFMGVLAGTSLLLAAATAERLTTERRERAAADVLRHREEMLRLAQRAGGVATFEWDFRNQVARCSAEFFRIFGLPAEDGVMRAADWAGFVHPDDRDLMSAHLARALQRAEPAVLDYRINAADGSTRWLSYSGRIEHTLDGDRMLGTVVDITDRKRLEGELRHHAAKVERVLGTVADAEAALRESRDVLSLAMRSGSMGAWSRNLGTNEVWWSRELEELFGLDPGTFSRTEADFLDLVHEDDRPAVRSAVDGAVRAHSDYIVEFRFRHASGEWRWMEGRGRAVYAEDGTPRHLYGIGIDVTGPEAGGDRPAGCEERR